MATLREYFETDFSHVARVHITLAHDGTDVEGVVMYDMPLHAAGLALYVTGEGHSLEFFIELLRKVQPGTPMIAANRITLPTARHFPGSLKIHNDSELKIGYRLYGDSTWKLANEITSSGRMIIYSESNLPEENIIKLQGVAGEIGHKLLFRSSEYVKERTRCEIPLAFISHDSRDKDTVARRIAVGLQKMLCPVWYDEFSLKVGAPLRESIEKGLRECKKCIIVLSPSFLANNGWTKKEFESVFTREILEGTNLVLPVWCGITKEQVYGYCSSLLNIKGIDWNALGEEESCRQLFKAIVD